MLCRGETGHRLPGPGGPGQCEPAASSCLECAVRIKMVKMVFLLCFHLPQTIKVMFQEEKMSVRSKVGDILQRKHKS